MGHYLLTYHGGGGMQATPEEQQASMGEWMAWHDQLGDAVIDFGAPIMQGKRIKADGSVIDPDDKMPLGGYSLIQAESLDAACALAMGCPHLKTGGDVDVHETNPMMPEMGQAG